MKLLLKNNLQGFIDKFTALTIIISIAFALFPHASKTSNLEEKVSEKKSEIANLEEKQPLENTEKTVTAPKVEVKKKILVVATAYESKPEQTDSTPCITANGFDLCSNFAKNGLEDTIAANFLPFGTKVRFPDIYGDRIFVVRDRMNKKYGYGRVDVWLNDHARIFGVKKLTMEIL